MKNGDLIAERYRLQKRLGAGTMGEVWSAEHSQTGRAFAVKFLHVQFAQAATARQRFLREARASATINHPAVVDVFDVGEAPNGSLYLVMELLEGVSLYEGYESIPTMSAREFLSVIHSAGEALSAAHAAGVIHRDIKPQNIFLHRERESGLATAKLVDFGISKFDTPDDGIATQAESLLGSPRYMSPEQTRNAAAIDGRSDVWSLGVVMFEGFTGEFPHDGENLVNLAIAISTEAPKSIHELAPQLPTATRNIIEDCLKPLRSRIQSAQDLLARLDEALQDEALDEIRLPYQSMEEKTRRYQVQVKVAARRPPKKPATAGDAAGAGHPGAARTPPPADDDNPGTMLLTPEQQAAARGSSPALSDTSDSSPRTFFLDPSQAPSSQDALPFDAGKPLQETADSSPRTFLLDPDSQQAGAVAAARARFPSAAELTGTADSSPRTMMLSSPDDDDDDDEPDSSKATKLIDPTEMARAAKGDDASDDDADDEPAEGPTRLYRPSLHEIDAKLPAPSEYGPPSAAVLPAPPKPSRAPWIAIAITLVVAAGAAAYFGGLFG